MPKYKVNIILDNDNWLIVQPLNHEAAMFYGKGTIWCVSSSNDSYFKKFHEEDDIIIVFNKKEKSENKKIGIHFKSEHFQNANNRYYQPGKYFNEHPEVFNALESRIPKKIKNNIVIYRAGDHLKDFEFNDSISLKNFKNIKYIENIKVKGDLILHSEIKSIKNIHVEGYLFAGNSDLEFISGDFYVGMSAKLMNCKLTSLPEKGYVGGNLYITSNKVSNISENFEVGINLYARDTDIKDLPSNHKIKHKIFVGEYIKG